MLLFHTLFKSMEDCQRLLSLSKVQEVKLSLFYGLLDHTDSCHVLQVHLHVLWRLQDPRKWVIWVWNQVMGATWPQPAKYCLPVAATGTEVWGMMGTTYFTMINFWSSLMFAVMEFIYCQLYLMELTLFAYMFRFMYSEDCWLTTERSGVWILGHVETVLLCSSCLLNKE